MKIYYVLSFSGMILIYVCIHYICVYRYLYTLYIDLQRKNNQIVSDFLSANLAAAGNQFRVITDNWEKTIHSPYIIHLSEKKKKHSQTCKSPESTPTTSSGNILDKEF